MAITTTYGLLGGSLISLEDFDGTEAPDVAFLANGNFAITGEDNAGSGVFSPIRYFDPAGTSIFYSGPSQFGIKGVVAGLTGGGTVVAVERPSDFQINYRVLDNSGANFGVNATIPGSGSKDPAISALSNGGFAITYSVDAAVDRIALKIFNAVGNEQFSVTINATSDASLPAITQLENGNIALMWSQADGSGGTDTYTAVYSTTGAVVVAPKISDSAGTVNKAVSLAPLVGGGFLAVYEDNGWGSGTDITLAKLDDNANITGYFYKNVSDGVTPADGSTDAAPDIARVFGNVFAVTWNHQGAFNGDIGIALINGDTGEIYQGSTTLVGNGSNTGLSASSIAANTSNGQIVVVSQQTGGTGDLAQHLAAARIITGDALANTITATSDLAHVLYGEGGADKLTGNIRNDRLYGGEGNDKLDGKSGADVMEGGAGNDSYTVDNIGDTVTELFNQGKDSVKSSISYLLGPDVENLTLTGSAAINGTGNALANSIKGNNGNNVLLGLDGKDIVNGGKGDDTVNGGTGKDKLTGGIGADKFVFDNIGPSADRDDITDFVSGTDKIVLDKSVFTVFAAYASGAAITAADFVMGTAATNGNQNIIYDNTTGALYYDQDGNGGAFSQVMIADLGGNPALLFSDIVIL